MLSKRSPGVGSGAAAAASNAALISPCSSSVWLDSLDRVAAARFLVLLRVAVTRWVVGGVVEAHAVRNRLDEGRAVARSSLLDSADDDVIDGHHIISVHLDAFEAVAGRAQREARGGGLYSPRG